MAGVDKLYLSDWSKYEELRDWLKSVGPVVKDDFGNTIIDPYLYLAEYTKEEFEDFIERLIKEDQDSFDRGDYKYCLECGWMTQEEYDNYNPRDHVDIPVMNNPVFFDVWLIRYCPLEWLQELLKKQYGETYESIKNRTSLYDTYKRNGLGKNIKVKLPRSCRHIYGISIKFPEDHEFSVSYDDENNRWNNRLELREQWSFGSTAFHWEGPKKNKRLFKRNRKSIFRCLQKWDLPEGTKVELVLDNCRKFKTIETTIKKKYYD